MTGTSRICLSSICEQGSFFDNLTEPCAMELSKLVVSWGGCGSESDCMEKDCRIRGALGTVNV